MATKEQAKHTPGPWKVYDDTCAACKKEGAQEFVIFGPPGGHHGQFSNEADARLIAAAPEMLEALKIARQTMDKYDDVGWSDGAIGLIDEVIAKAEGRS